jgi:hypothetical protein
VSPLRALVSILLVGAISEVKTFYWPSGIITGTFDYLDIVAYATGLLLCFYFDTRKRKSQTPCVEMLMNHHVERNCTRNWQIVKQMKVVHHFGSVDMMMKRLCKYFKPFQIQL